MNRSTGVLGACLGAFLILLPLGFEKPGLPMHLRADEPTYLAMTESLVLDGDLRCEPRDVERLFAAFPYSRPMSLHLKGRWEDEAPSFDRSPLFAWIAALPVYAFGADGLLALNGFFFVGILALAAARRRADGSVRGPGPAFAAIFLVTGAAFVQVFWLGPALAAAFLVAVALRAGEGDDAHASRPELRRLGSGAAFGLAVGLLPWLGLLAPSFLVPSASGGRRRVMSWLGGCALGLALAWGSGAVLGVGPSGELEARTYTVASPYEAPWLEGEAPEPASGLGEPASAAVRVGKDLLYALVEQRTGFLPYFPATLVLLGLLVANRRSLRPSTLGLDRLLLGAGIGVSIFLQPWVESSEVGTTAFGNPALVALCPAILFLVRTPPPAWSGLVAVFLGVLTLGPALVGVLGPAVAYGGPQSHTRAAVLSRLPLDTARVGAEGDYKILDPGGPSELGLRLWVPMPVSRIRGDEAWLLGRTTARLYLESARPLDDVVWQVRNLASDNRVDIRFAGERQTLHFEEVPELGTTTRVSFRPEGDRRLRSGEELWLYPLEVTSRRGAKPFWGGSANDNFYLGAAVAYLGSESFLNLPVYGAEHLVCEAPDEIEADEEFLALSKIRNAGEAEWPVGGAVEVRLGYRWLSADGEVVAEGERTDLPHPIGVGEEITSWVKARAPRTPGTYFFEIDPIYENVAWFSHRGVSGCRSTVHVVREEARPGVTE